MNKYVMRILLVMVLLCSIFALFGCSEEQAIGEVKQVSVDVIIDGVTTQSLGGETTVDNLGDFLLESGKVEGENGPYGLYIKSVDGRTADSSKEEWWCITKGGEEVLTGVDNTPISDGDVFELTLKVGY